MTSAELHKLYSENKEFQSAFIDMDLKNDKVTIINTVKHLVRLHAKYVDKSYLDLLLDSDKLSNFFKLMVDISPKYRKNTVDEKPKSEWILFKDELINDLKNLGITDKDFITKFVKFYRRIFTCRRMYNVQGMSYSKLVFTDAFGEAENLLSDIYNNYLPLYKKYNELKHYSNTHKIDDYLS